MRERLESTEPGGEVPTTRSRTEFSAWSCTGVAQPALTGQPSAGGYWKDSTIDRKMSISVSPSFFGPKPLCAYCTRATTRRGRPPDPRFLTISKELPRHLSQRPNPISRHAGMRFLNVLFRLHQPVCLPHMPRPQATQSNSVSTNVSGRVCEEGR